jgi:UDP-N-acetylmuramoyl-tripeptide--D-alanyl-D-alanine ligase
MGANHPGEIENLCHMARPQFGIITNIGKAHLEGFGNFQGVINAKSELFRFVAGENGTLFINEDNELLVRLSEGMKKYSYGRSSLAWCKGETIKNDPFLEVIWNAGHQRGIVNTGLYGSYNFENVMAAITIGVYFGVAPAEIDNSIRLYQPENNRSQVTLTENNTLLMDAYNANPSSMTAALENFGSYNASAKMVILGDMMELGVHSIIEHKEIIQLVRKYQFDRVCLVGENFSLAAGTGNELKFPDLKTAEKWFREHPVRNMTILIKGSRKMQLEKLNYLF